MAGAPIPGDCGGSGDCPEYTTSVATTGLCLDDATPIAIVVTRDCEGVVSEDGWLDLTTGIFTPGPPPPGTSACTTDNYDFALSGWLCDILPDGSVAGIALVQIERDGSGAVIAITLIGVDGLPYVPVGIMTRCPEDRLAAEILCDSGAAGIPFVRFYTYSPIGAIPARDTDLDGAPYVVVGPVVNCIEEVTGPGGDPVTVDVNNWRDDAEYQIICDDDTDPPTPFLRRYDVDSGGTVTTTDTEIDGTTPYVVAGTAVVCAVDISFPTSITVDGTVDIGNWRDDAEYAVLCDQGAADTPFVRRYDVSDTGVVTTTDTELDGTTAYVVVGPAGICPVTQSTTVTVDGTVNVEAPDTSNGEVIRAGKVRVAGVGDSWILGTDSGGGRVKSVTFICLNDGVPGSGSGVTVTDDFGNTTDLNTGESASWSVEALDSELDTTLRVDTTDAQAVVDVLWTEVA